MVAAAADPPLPKASSKKNYEDLNHKPRVVTLDDVPFLVQLLSYFNFLIAMIASHSRDQMRRFRRWVRRRSRAQEGRVRKHEGYPQILDDFSTFYERELYGRLRDCWYRPICSNPGPWIDVMLRSGHPLLDDLVLTGETRRCLNMASYNYLGFSETEGPCTDKVEETLRKSGVGCCSVRTELGSLTLHRKLEKQIAAFLKKEDAIIFAMGYATNSTNIPALVGKGGLILSDSLNHASIVVGCRASGATIRIFKHNDPENLEKVIQKAIVDGQPRTHRPWTKILIVVEGIYSMEGEICKLKEIVAIKKKYKCYLYVDEAHSIGALGVTGRGVSEYHGIDSSDVDIFMGTFTKSFASVGGYIASSKEVIDFIRIRSFSTTYDASMSAANTTQCIAALNIISGQDGTQEGAKRLAKLAKNTRYVRRNLNKMGFDVIGSPDSPVVPIMIYQPTKMPAFSRLCLNERLAVVIASYPVTELMLSRVRLCLSSSHSKEDLDYALNVISHLGDVCLLKYNLRFKGERHHVPKSIECPREYWEKVKPFAERQWSWKLAEEEPDYDSD